MSKNLQKSAPKSTTEPNKKLSRSEQSRINGAKSNGPVRPKASPSPLMKALTANIHTVLHLESGAAYTENLDAWIDNLRPALANFTYIDDIGALAAAAASKASSGRGNGLDLLRRRLATLQNQLNSNFKMFEKLEARRLDLRRIKNPQFPNPCVRPKFESVIDDEPQPEETVQEPVTQPSEPTPRTSFQHERKGPQSIDSKPKSPITAPSSSPGVPGRKAA